MPVPYVVLIRWFCRCCLWLLMLFFGISWCKLFHVFIVLCKQLRLNFEVLCDGIVSFSNLEFLVFTVEMEFWYSWQIFWEDWSFKALCTKTASCTCLLWYRFNSLSWHKELVAESYLRFPVIDFAAKFWTICKLFLSFTPHPCSEIVKPTSK